MRACVRACVRQNAIDNFHHVNTIKDKISLCKFFRYGIRGIPRKSPGGLSERRFGMAEEEKYKRHFLMGLDDVKDYAVSQVKYFKNPGALKVEEIGDGNINYVFRVKDPESGKSLVIKQADKLLRASGRPLALHRNKIEAAILGIQRELAPEFVPEIYHYDETMYALAMEDISEYKNMRKELMAGKIFPRFKDDITDFMVKTLVPTTDLVLDSRKKKEYVKLFINYDCCDISEDLVFTKPYGDYQGRNHNIITPGNEDFVKSRLYENRALHTEAALLRNNFMNNSQALIHGDLHSGSIFINREGIKVIDPEFAFYGPMGYDVGNVIGNLHFSWAYINLENRENPDFQSWVSDAISGIFDLTKKKMAQKLAETVSFPLYTPGFQKSFFEDVMADALGYAGTEIIRRTVGDSKVAELDSLETSERKLTLERNLVETGIWLIMNRQGILEGKEITKRFSDLLTR